MDKVTIGLASLILLLAAEADAQSVSSRVTGAVSGVGSVAVDATTGGAPAADPYRVSPGSAAGGDLSGGVGMKVGEKVIKFRGAVGVGDDRGNVKAGVGVPF